MSLKSKEEKVAAKRERAGVSEEQDKVLRQAFKNYGVTHGERGEEPSWGPTAAKESLLRRIAKRLGLIREPREPLPKGKDDTTIGPG